MNIYYKKAVYTIGVLLVTTPCFGQDYPEHLKHACDAQPKPPLESCIREFIPVHNCVCYYTRNYEQSYVKQQLNSTGAFNVPIDHCQWDTDCRHPKFPTAAYNATTANKWKDGPGAAYTGALMRADQMEINSRK